MAPIDYMELAKQLNPWIAAAGALLGVIVAGFINLTSQVLVGWLKRRSEAKTLRIALLSEIYGIVSIIEVRGYIAGLNAAPQKMHKAGVDTWSFGVKMAENYCPVYHANAFNIGLLKPSEASHIVGFHQIILSVIQDVTPGGVLYDGGTADQFGEAAALLEHAVEMGNNLTKKAGIPNEPKS